MRRYQIAFFVALIAALLLGGAAGYLWYHPRPMPAMVKAAADSPSASPPVQEAREGQSSEPKLHPVQLTAQRMQSIGVQTGPVEMKTLHDEIRTTGNVEIDETRLAWVQLRRVSSISTLPVVRISSCSVFISTGPVCTPMLCIRCAVNWTGWSFGSED